MVKVNMGSFKKDDQLEQKNSPDINIESPISEKICDEKLEKSEMSPIRSRKTTHASRNKDDVTTIPLSDLLVKRIEALETAIQKPVDPTILKIWDSIYKNFVKRHVALKNQAPLKLQYEIINDFFHPQ